MGGTQGCRTIAVVLARAGSKGLPGKNVAPVAGRPCVAWTIEAALAAATVDAVLVSSDSPEVLAIGREMGATPVEREPEHASDTATVDDAVRACLRRAAGLDAPVTLDGRDPSACVVILYGNVPVRPAGLIDRAVALLRRTGCSSVQSYAPVGKFHPWWQARLGEDGRVTPWEGDRLFNGVYRRQALPASFVPDGGVLVVSRTALMLEESVPPGPHAFLGRDHRGVRTEAGEVVDIDDAVDLAVAEARLRGVR